MTPVSDAPERRPGLIEIRLPDDPANEGCEHDRSIQSLLTAGWSSCAIVAAIAPTVVSRDPPQLRLSRAQRIRPPGVPKYRLSP